MMSFCLVDGFGLCAQDGQVVGVMVGSGLGMCVCMFGWCVFLGVGWVEVL